MKKNILFSAALMFFCLASSAQTTITFDSEDYKSITVYDKWEKSPFRTGVLSGNAAVTENPDVSETTETMAGLQSAEDAANQIKDILGNLNSGNDSNPLASAATHIF